MWRNSWAMSGGTPAKEKQECWDGDILWVSPTDMKRRLIDSSEETINTGAIAETGIKLIATPLVLVVVRGMILAHTLPVELTAVPVTIKQEMKALRFRDDVSQVFMTWMFEDAGNEMLLAA
jgi:type I restriction enzyme S subunit